MKFLFALFTTLAFQIGYSQKVPFEKGDIKIEIISHYLDRKENKKKAKISNTANRPSTVYHLTEDGILLEKTGYGKQHNTNLKLMDYIKVYEYENGRLKTMVEWESDYDKVIYPYWKTKYSYDIRNNLIEETMLYAETDSLFKATKYDYDDNNNLIKTILSPTHYREHVYDSNYKLTSYRDFYNNKLYWEYNYTYTDSTRIGKFQTHYDDGENYTKEEIKTYKDSLIIEFEVRYTSQEGIDDKAIYYYNKYGLIEKTEYYTRHSISEGYRLKSYITYKYKGIKNPDMELVKKINVGIFNLK